MNLNSIRIAMHYLVPLLAAAALLSRGASATDDSRLKQLQDARINILEDELPIHDVLPNFVRLTRRPPPTVQAGPAGAELQCEALGKPAPSVLWLKNDEPIVEPELDSSERSSAPAASVARVASTLLVRAGAAGRYTCVVRSGGRTVAARTVVHSEGPVDDSLRARLLPLEPRILTHYKVFMTNIGDTVELPCRARGHPRPRVAWTDARGRPVAASTRMKVLRSGALRVSSLTWADMGEYSCVAASRAGAAAANTFVYPIAV